ncbi:hypothetical protein [Bradyrhizobium stylosanthis]|uniref:Uncharacterized protein n=1 Tax=Bradyrhizobium stylosanthis TaxID=1803665 RepID=A0A560DK78_9BRAD|nr:hypothetical protein [Bradyrhizobium stylosanthis]TWA97508.1 hypothetical protein FBZ96_106564 [Bradyrhizobium stylosanthis]
MHQRLEDLPLEEFAIIVDGHSKATFSTREGAHRAAIELKGRFPAIQIKVYDAAARQTEFT